MSAVSARSTFAIVQTFMHVMSGDQLELEQRASPSSRRDHHPDAPVSTLCFRG